MPCSGAYAAAWEFASFWCLGTILTGADDGGGVGVGSLHCSQVDFTNSGVEPNVGMVLYNLTTGLSGLVTVVSGNDLTAVGVTWTNGDLFRIVTISGVEIGTINRYLGIAAADVHAALHAVGACECTLAGWAIEFLKKLNIIDAAAYYMCKCGQPAVTPDQQKTYLQWADAQFKGIREGEIEVCEGATGKGFPAIGWAEQSTTEFAGADIIKKDLEKGIP